MKLTIVLAGIFLLVVGLLSYSLIPNIHTVPIQTSQRVVGPSAVSIEPGFSVASPPQNISVLPGKQNELRINITVSSTTGESSPIQFRLFTKDRSQYCMPSYQPTRCLINTNVSNTTITVPLNASDTYYLVFENTGSSGTTKVTFSALMLSNSVETIPAKDGSFNFAGLGVGALGFLVVLYGASRKNAIPWE